MNQYREMKKRHQEAFNKFSENYMFFAFNDQQAEEGILKVMKANGLESLEPKAIAPTGAGGYILKTAIPAYKELFKTFDQEQAAAIAADPDGTGFIFEMFTEEMFNHEYGLTEDPEDSLNACGITWADLEANPALMAGFRKASEYVTENTF